ncbi:MAG: 6-phosphofructokinase [Lachnospiraceae bacterium]|jgi:6-phosphofructokinase 1|uniref:6-phosphofructokinase n=1 Tax=Hominisplanchenecus murintestinalis TaxID=2941517 RepID=A0AC61QWP3_9FIRM|nr:6-phosphofructokinase [Hominisplanchenecus murintestinalis]MCI9515971.1 6-phosphofructokinase [Lachnospiraceae bacterium]RKJ95842.1 6-phosphofructokinase [Anaerotruncus sp. 1XD22-93]MCI9660473.1 6-phosphofructokinase [Lachnospiraceae bacterium]NBH97574.1 6-phosphofructokinase [Lachnospiraceae bacterium]NBI74631.1 6-phosphofructokinase [Lachnospiraceae bacterium]
MKGNIVVGQSGGPTAVINSSLAGVFSAAKALGVKKIYGMHHGIQGFLNEDLIDISEYVKDDKDVELLKRTPSAFLGSCRYKLPKIEGNEEVYDKIFEILEKYDIECLFYIGGNDSMDTIKMLSDYAAMKGKSQRFMGVPKTIDNDLPITDHCPGYGSAAKYIATSMKEIIRDNESFGVEKPTVTIVEIMGRHAGWLTAAAALSRGEDCDGPDMIYLPEVTFDVDDFVERVKKLAAEKSSVVIAVSEGLKLADGRFACELGNASDFVDAFGHKQLSGCAAALANIVAGATGLKTRAVEFSTLQRAATHIASLQDINEAFSVGYLAGQAAEEGKTGMMITIDVKERNPYQVGYSIYDIHAIANVERPVPAEWIINDGTDVSEEYVNYARPLILGELTPMMVNGTPRHLVLKK